MASSPHPRRAGLYSALLVSSLWWGPWGCRKTTGDGPRAFPENFTFGAAMAGFQVDPGCPTLTDEDCEDRASDWYQWVTDEDLIADSSTYLSGDALSNGPGHWELYAEDFARASDDLHLTSLRNSLEWSRLFPDEPDATTVEELAEWADPDAVQAYHDMFSAMQAAGIEPLVTLNHYTLPLWIHDGKACHEDIETCSPAGWADPDRLIEQIALYSGWCAMEFGHQVDNWLTLNEPFAVAMAGYLLPGEDRTNPPGVVRPDLAVQTIWAMVEAHGAMYDAVHSWDEDARVGAAPNLAYPQAEDPDDPIDQQGAEHFDYVYNRTFLDGTVLGRLDRDLDGEAEELREDLVGRMDFIGVNYYTAVTISGLPIPLFGDYAMLDFLPVGSLWQEAPEGMTYVLELAHDYGLPVMITENGTSTHEDATDRFLVPHLAALLDAVDAGVEVEGYYVWSLIDNYEWNHGMNMPFGLYEVDIDTKERTLRPMGADYGEIAQSGALPY